MTQILETHGGSHMLKYIWPWNWPSDLEVDVKSPKNFQKWIVQAKSSENEVLHLFLALFGENHIFAYLTLKLTFWPWNWPSVFKDDSKSQNWYQKWILQSKLHKNEVLQLFLPLFVEKSYLTLKLNFDLEFTP